MTQHTASTSLGFRRLTIVTSAWVLFLIFAGAIVRVTGSGMGCPDWPLCYSQVIPPAQMKAWIEVLHRIIAGVASLLTIAIAVEAWRSYRQERFIFKPALWAVAVVLFQAFLGAVTVWFSNHPLTVVAHLLAGLAYLGITLFVATAAHLPSEYLERPGLTTQSQKSHFRFLLLWHIQFL